MQLLVGACQLGGRLFERLLRPLHLGDVLDGEQNHLRLAVPIDPTGVEQHRLSADALKVVRNLEIVKRVVLGKDVFEQPPKIGMSHWPSPRS